MAESRATRSLVESIGEPTIRKIAHDLEAAGLAVDDPWLYAEMVTESLAAQRFMFGRIVTRPAGGGLVPMWFRVPFEWSPRHERYRLEILGRRLSTGDDAAACPRDVVWTWQLDASGYEVEQVAAYRARAVHLDSSAFALADWRPGWAEPDYFTGGDEGRQAKWKAARVGMAMLQDVRSGGRGRPDGSGAFPTEAIFREKAEPFVRSFRAAGRHPSKERVAEKLDIEPRHLQDVCRQRTGLNWPDFLASVTDDRS